MKHPRPRYRRVKKKNDIVNYVLNKYKRTIIIPKPRNQDGETCQFSAMAGGADMGFKRSRADAGNVEINFKEEKFFAQTKMILGIQEDIPACEVLNIFERYGVPATCSEWDGEQTRTILGSSYSGSPDEQQVIDLILKGVPMLADFECCNHLFSLKKNEVYHSLPITSEAERKENGVEGHMVLICGYGLTFDQILYLLFLNSWDKGFCDNGVGRIEFTSITFFHTIEMFAHPERNVITEEDKTVILSCYGFQRKVELSVVNACDYLRNKRPRRGKTLVLPELVSPLSLSLILGYLRLQLQPSKVSTEAFVKGLDAEMMYELMMAAASIHLRDLSKACAMAFLDRTIGWSEEQINELMPSYKEGWSKMQSLAKSFASLSPNRSRVQKRVKMH